MIYQTSNEDFMPAKTKADIVMKRVTFVVPGWLDRALEVYCSGTGEPKSVAATQAFEAFLTKHLDELRTVVRQLEECVRKV